MAYSSYRPEEHVPGQRPSNPSQLQVDLNVPLGDPGRFTWRPPSSTGSTSTITVPAATASPTTYTPSSSGGGGGYGYGGGGGGGGAAMTQTMFDAMARLIGATRPEDMPFTPQQFNRYKRRPFYEFNRQPYQQARQDVRQGARKDLRTNRQATANARAEMENYENPYAGGLRATSEDLSSSMGRMLAANDGAGAEAAGQVSAEGAQADAAMGNVAALLAANDQRRQQSNLSALDADSRMTAQRIRDERANLITQVNLAKAQALEQYKRERWAYGEAVAQMNWQRRNQVIDNNFAMQTQTAQQNTTNQNAWTTSVLGPIMQILGMKPDADPAQLLSILGLEG